MKVFWKKVKNGACLKFKSECLKFYKDRTFKEVCASFNVLKFKCISIVFAQPGNLILTLYKDLKPGHKHAFNLQPISIVPPSM